MTEQVIASGKKISFDGRDRFDCGLPRSTRQKIIVPLYGSKVVLNYPHRSHAELSFRPMKLNGEPISHTHADVKRAMHIVHQVMNGRTILLYENNGVSIYHNGKHTHRHSNTVNVDQVHDIIYQHFNIIINGTSGGRTFHDPRELDKVLYPTQNYGSDYNHLRSQIYGKAV